MERSPGTWHRKPEGEGVSTNSSNRDAVVQFGVAGSGEAGEIQIGVVRSAGRAGQGTRR